MTRVISGWIGADCALTSRRHVLGRLSRQAAFLSACAWGPAATAVGVSAARSRDESYETLNRFPRMLHEFFVQQVRESEQRHLRNLSQLQSQADARRYVASAQARIRQCFGAEPPRTPLNPRVTGTLDRGAYRIENVIFESRPGFPVTANLYIPQDRPGPFPGVVGTCGHSANGKAAEAYQSFAQGLARLGFVCLIYDPIGQGERLQYVRDDFSPAIGTGTAEHLHAGNQQFLVGEFFGMWRAWDGIRALDYLVTRPEVDPQHLGVTGNSGGGTMTTWLCGVEQRWTMGAPSCFVTTFRRNLENELPQDTEQCPPRALALDLDHTDFLAAMAPKPVIILAKERDYFDVRGAEETYERLRRLYGLLGAEDQIALFVGPTEHGYSQENREAMYAWFRRSAGQPGGTTEGMFDGVLHATGAVEFTAEPDLTIEPDEALWCTPRGQVAAMEGTRTVIDFTRDKSRQLAERRTGLRGTALRQAIRQVLKLPAGEASAPDYRNWRYLTSRGFPAKAAMAWTIDTEPGIQAIVYGLTDQRWHSRPAERGRRAILYVAELSSDAELREEPLIRQLVDAEPGTPVFTCDVRGIGESLPGTCSPGSFHSPYGSDYFYAIHSIMLDRPLLGQTTFDVLRVLDWLAATGHVEIHLAGRGRGAIAAALAAVMSDQVVQVTLKWSLTSWTEVAESAHYDWPLACLPPGVLQSFDLPDCYAELEQKQLWLIEPRGAAGAK